MRQLLLLLLFNTISTYNNQLVSYICCTYMQDIDATSRTATFYSPCRPCGSMIKDSNFKGECHHAKESCIYCSCFVVPSLVNAYYCCTNPLLPCGCAFQACLASDCVTAQKHAAQIILHSRLSTHTTMN